MKAGVFFERDGVLNKVKVERHTQIVPVTVEEFEFNERVIEPLQRLKSAGFVLIVTTNQPGVSRGTLSRRELDLMHLQLRARLPLDDILVCPHDETDQCPCRKPKAGLLLEASFKWHLDFERCYVVSDKWQDAQAAHAAGCTSILLESPWNGSGHHDFIRKDLESAVCKIIELHQLRSNRQGRD